YLQLERTAVAGASCSPNGLVGRDNTGAILFFFFFFWRKSNSGSTVITGRIANGQQIPLPTGCGFYDEYNFHKGTFRADLTGKCSYVVACQN
ncbi:shufflon system plasmid conjugative transfer pilus tip adhesin PilV, partial [Escherichia coli]|uniref:shufflon system plasmid conjugative transfer pilus tip adhesin PilV n=1 Tax=Escherichia coli TaxID=562 RepID=UPI0011615C67